MKTALVYDRVNKWGGAERVLLSLHKLFPKAPLYTSVYNKKTASWADVFDVRTSFLQNFPRANVSHESYAFLMPLAFESFNFDEFDLVISVTSEAAKGIITKPSTLHVCYCLTPTRYLWSGYEDYFSNKLLKKISKPVVKYLRNWDLSASKRPDEIIAISSEVKDRIRKYYQRESFLIHPPFQKLKKTSKNSVKEKDYFLIVSRLVPYKKIELAIEAFNRLGWQLKIIGTGWEEKRLKKMAKSNIEFLGALDEDTLIDYYQNCIALVFPGVEDFGLVMVEAQSFGKPVIAFKKGGAMDIIREGKTGVFFKEQRVESLIKALTGANYKNYNMKLSVENANRFLEVNFNKSFLALIEKRLGKNRKK
jgi:glycosyltransferase involved in cell wall biosynthesis